MTTGGSTPPIPAYPSRWVAREATGVLAEMGYDVTLRDGETKPQGTRQSGLREL